MAGYVFNYYRNNASYQINDQTNRFLLGVHGLGVPKITYPTMRAPYTDGEVLLGAPPPWPPTDYLVYQPTPVPYVTPREIEIMIGMQAASLSALETAYAALIAAMSPHRQLNALYPSYLYILLPDTTTYRAIACFCSGVSDMDLISPKYARVTLTFFAYNPYFVLPGFGAAVYTNWDTGTNPKTITNSGDAPLWSPKIIVYGSASTTIVGLHLTNNTSGKVWSTSQTIAIGVDYGITVFMDRAMMNYWKTGAGASNTDIISKLDSDAEFWPLLAGDNALQWSSTSGTPSKIEVFHPWLYLGI